jgi:hypothetical protein
MATSSDIIKKKMIEALEKSLGVVTTACKTAGIARSTHYEWMESDENYKKSVEGLKDIALDFAESKLFKSIENGSDTATIFYLKTQGKKRGYIEKQEIVHEIERPIFKEIDLDVSEDNSTS